MLRSKEIVNAIGVHGNWKKRLRRAIETGNSDFTVDELIVDNQCDFGKWLHSLSSDDKEVVSLAQNPTVACKIPHRGCPFIRTCNTGEAKRGFGCNGRWI